MPLPGGMVNKGTLFGRWLLQAATPGETVEGVQALTGRMKDFKAEH